VGAVLGSVLLAELATRFLLPQVRLSYTEAGFSPRYHHTSPEFSALLHQIQHDPAKARGEITVVLLGDSFVAGEGMSADRRFTSIMQRHYDSLPSPRITIIGLGFTSYSTVLYDRLYKDVVLPLDPDIVIVCLDQTDVADDYLYGQELTSTGEFANTVLQNYESYPATFFFLRHSRIFLQANTIKQRWTGRGFVPNSSRAGARDATKLTLYLETCKDPASHGDLFQRSAQYIQSIAALKPPRQKLYFVTYPRAENLAGQRKTTLLYGALSDSHASTPYFEYWIRKTNLAVKYPTTPFVHTTDAFRAAIASTGRQYYFRVNDVHWNEEGQKLFAEILESAIINPAAGVN